MHLFHLTSKNTGKEHCQAKSFVFLWDTKAKLLPKGEY